MIFNTGYYHPMDKDYEDIGLSPKNIGVSTHPAKDALESLKAAVFQGASRVEIGFTGTGKGNKGQNSPTPESYGRDERLALKELAKVNEVKLSTHSSVAVSGFAGLGRDNTFDDATRSRNITEVKKAVDFAADVTEGGAVVIHTGEFPRSIYGSFKDEKFSAYPEEKDKRIHHLVDGKTGKIIQGVRQDEEVFMPVPIYEEDGKTPQYLKNADGSNVYDEFGRVIPKYQTDDTGNIIVKKKTFQDFYDEGTARGESEDKIVVDFFTQQQQRELGHSLGQAREYERHYISGTAERTQLIEKHNYFQRLKKIINDKLGEGSEAAKEEWSKITNAHKDECRGMDPVGFYKTRLDDNERNIAYGREIGISSRRQAYKMNETLKNIKTIKEYGIQKTADSIAKLAKYAMQKTKAAKLEKPLYISPENIFPETYGSHPDELKEIVQTSRKRFIELNKEKYGESRAKELAKRHIKATFDIGHVYTWKKYFNGKDKDFHKWVDKKVENLLENGIIGHVHVSDNFGYEDEHLTPGQGILTKERLQNFIQRIKKHGITDVVVEAGGQAGGAGWRAMLGGWDVFGSPIYGAERVHWTNVQHSYFGRANSPTYIFGEYSPSNEFKGAPFWSGLGLE